MDWLDLLELRKKGWESRVGSVKTGATFARFRSRGQVLRDLVVSVVVILGVVALAFWLSWPRVWLGAVACLGLIAYLLLGHFVRARPNHDEMGPGGIVDHPFRVSDDVNRRLLGLALFLLPANYLSAGLVDGIHYLGARKLPQERLLDQFDTGDL